VRMHASIGHSCAVIVLELSEEAVYLRKGTNKDAGILLTSDNTGSEGIWD